ncbi:MAG: AP2 domain-containing protein [Calditrichota bacterium]|jgi:hypothetical protein
MPITKNRGISRIDSEACRTYGWYVRLRFNGKSVSKLFSDKKYGGKAQALMKARRFYKKSSEKLMKKMMKIYANKLPVKQIVTRNRRNNTGVVGVQRIDRKNSGGSIYQAFRVNWTDKTGKSKNKFFSIEKFGEKKAFELACEYRQEKVGENYF